MDKNTVIGFSLMGLIIIGFFWINQPTDKQKEAYRQYQDSIRTVRAEENKLAQELAGLEEARLTAEESDSVKMLKAADKYGAFSAATIGENEIISLENPLIKLELNTKGGDVNRVTLKEFNTYRGDPVVLLEGEDSRFNLLLNTGNSIINTSEMNFQVKALTDSSIVLALPAGEGKSLDYTYTLRPDDYMVNFTIRANDLSDVLIASSDVNAVWKTRLRQQERGRKFENRFSALYFKPLMGSVDNLSESSNERKEVTTGLRWIAFKGQFFSSVLIADREIASSVLKTEMAPENSEYLKFYTTEMLIPFDATGKTETGFRYYFGPNRYTTLKSYDRGVASEDQLQLQKLVPLGWGIFRWVNQLLIIPMFDFFGSFMSNYGLIILLMTIVIKILLFPLTYKSYMSSAKMRVLRPQVEEINARIPADKPTERQQAVMAMYRKAGVNPMGGCLPMLLQMPILFAMFSFFPSSIELRQQSFLWAQDLSSYDAIWTWDTYIPIISPYFGNHLSLFCLLMTITNLIYTHINMKMTDTGAQQMPGMKVMMYIMPVMFLFFFNDYASGLSYYYFVSTLITILQTYAIRKFVDEEKLLTVIKENQKKPQKKSAWLERLEQAQKQQEELKKKRK